MQSFFKDSFGMSTACLWHVVYRVEMSQLWTQFKGCLKHVMYLVHSNNLYTPKVINSIAYNSL